VPDGRIKVLRVSIGKQVAYEEHVTTLDSDLPRTVLPNLSPDQRILTANSVYDDGGVNGALKGSLMSCRVFLASRELVSR
jgi:hypothetical protein